MTRRPLIEEYQQTYGQVATVKAHSDDILALKTATREGDVTVNHYSFGGGGGGGSVAGAPRAAILYDAIVDSADPDVGANNIYATLQAAISDGHESIFFRESTDATDITINAEDVSRIVGDTTVTAVVPVNVTSTKIGVLFDSLNFNAKRLTLAGLQCRAFACFFTGSLTLATAQINNGAGITSTATTIAFDTGTLPAAGYGRIDNEYFGWGANAAGSLTSCVRGLQWTLRQTHADNAVITNCYDAHLIIDAEECDATACYFVNCTNSDAQGVLITDSGAKATLQVCRFLGNTLFNNLAIAPVEVGASSNPKGIQIIGCKFVGSPKDFHIAQWNASNNNTARHMNGLQVNGCVFLGMDAGAIKLFGGGNISGNTFDSGNTGPNGRTYAINLGGGISNSATTIPYDTAAGTGTLPAKGIIQIEDEFIAYSNVTATEFQNCIRSFNQSGAAVAHADNVAITAIAELCVACIPGDAGIGVKGILTSGNTFSLVATLQWSHEYSPALALSTVPRMELANNSIAGWKRAYMGISGVWSGNHNVTGSTPYVDVRGQTGVKFAGGGGISFEIRNKATDTDLDLMHAVSGSGILSPWSVPDLKFVVFGSAAGARSGACVPLVNRSGAASVNGHVAVQDVANDNSWLTVAAAGSALVVGVVQSNAIANLSETAIQTHGVAEVLCNGTVNRGDHLETSATNGEAQARGGGYLAGTTFARALTARAGGGASTVKALVYGCGG